MNNSVDSPATFPDWIMPWPELTVDWSKAALVMIDCQNYACNSTCGLEQMIIERHPQVASYYVPRLSQVTLPNIRRLLAAFRDSHREVIYTRLGPWLPDGRDMIARRRRRDAASVTASGVPQLWGRGMFEYEIIDALRPRAGELVVDKNCSSPFNGTGIDQMLRNMQLETLVVTGIATDMCVESTARDAADRGYNLVVVEDATATFFAEHHYAALSALARVYVQVRDTQHVLRELSAYFLT